MSLGNVNLGDLCSVITKGTTPSNIGASFTDKGIKYIRSEMLTSAKYVYGEFLHISQETHDKLKRSQLKAGDILFSMAGVYLGKTAILRSEDVPANTNQAVAIIRVDTDKADNEFVYYYLNIPEVVKTVNSIQSQAAQPNINLSQIGQIKIQLPTLNVQKRIVQILSSFDSLIETNQRQIKLLEEAAQRLYKEWFVDLQYPGHENVPVMDGVPEGWNRKRLVDIAEVQYGYAFDGHFFNDKKQGMPIVRIRNIPDGITGDYTTESADEQYLVFNGDIVVGMDGEFHINSWSGETSYLVQRTCRIRPKCDFMHGWLLQAIVEPIKYFEKTVVGATVAHLGKKHIDTIYLLVGPDRLYEPFQKFFERRQVLLNQNLKLSETRDRLLPKLMSGEITV